MRTYKLSPPGAGAHEKGKVEIFTDGACSGNPGACGIGIVFRYGQMVKEYSEFIGQGTNNIAELTAVLRALQMIKNPRLPVVIYLDSQYALGVLSLGWKAKENRDLIGMIFEEMKRFVDLRFVKVEGHANVPLNERADELARRSICTGGTSVNSIEVKKWRRMQPHNRPE